MVQNVPVSEDFTALGRRENECNGHPCRTQHNVVPDQCVFTVDVRSNENYSNEEIYQTACAHTDSEVKARSFRLNSSRIDENHPIVAKPKPWDAHLSARLRSPTRR